MCEVCIRRENAALIERERSRRKFKLDTAVNGVALPLRQGKPASQQAIDRAAAAIKELEAFERKASAL